MDGFFVVWCPSNGEPTVRHDTLSSARNEADRLAALHPGHQFHVLQSVGTARYSNVWWVDHQHDDIPF